MLKLFPRLLVVEPILWGRSVQLRHIVSLLGLTWGTLAKKLGQFALTRRMLVHTVLRVLVLPLDVDVRNF